MAEPEFKLGLALAGAISAGAYTAGVIDFLTEALEEFETKRGQDGVPGHRVGVKVVAGASAGAITGAIGLIAIRRGTDPQALSEAEIADAIPDGQAEHNPYRCVLPSLYDTWVERPRLVAEPGGGPDFLDVADLTASKDKPSQAGSLLNSHLLDAIKTSALKGTGRPTPPTRPYLAKDLHLYLTVSNLRGIPFSVDFGNASYGTLTHGDRIHYKLAGFGCWAGADTSWVARDPFLPLDAATLPVKPSDPIPVALDDYGTAALASAAFPVGLASRTIKTPATQFQDRSWPFEAGGSLINPLFPTLPGPAPTEFSFVSVDGGLINNSPFDYAEFALLDRPAHPGDKAAEGSATSGAVIMVAPFPAPPAFLPEGEPEPEISALIRALLPTLIGQARFRPSDLVKAMDPQYYSRFMVAPRRVQPGEIAPETYAIACGALGGFGGFLDREFRAHDYQLGRRNCQAFLRTTFALPVGARAIETTSRYRIPATPALPEKALIIPLVGTAKLDVALPPWPRMIQSDLDILGQRIETRLKALLPILIDSQTRSRLLQWIGRLGLLVGRQRLLDGVRFAILSDLIRRDQVEGFAVTGTYQAPLETVRAVAAELASPSFDYRTVAGIARKLHLAPQLVGAIIERLKDEPGGLRTVAAPWDATRFTLQLRVRPSSTTWPVVGPLLRWFSPPSDDARPSLGLSENPGSATASPFA